jgi:hypothetical protein
MTSPLERDAAEAIATLLLHEPFGLDVQTIEVHGDLDARQRHLDARARHASSAA